MGWFATLVREKKNSQKVIEWAVTSKCNLRCKHCYMGSEAHTHAADLNKIEREALAYKISKHADNVVLSGGEPLILNELFDIISILVPKCNVFLATNGTVYHDEMIMKIKTSGVRAVQVSIDYANEESHDEFRGVKGSWRKTMTFIEKLRAVEIPVIVCMTVMRTNYKELELFIEIMKNVGVCSVYMTRFVPVGTGEGYAELALQGEREKDFLQHYLKPAVRENSQYISTNIPQWNLYAGTMDLASVGCSMGHMLFINSGGNVSPCPMVDITLGNAKDKEFAEYYQDPLMRELKARTRVEGVCSSCEYLKNCSGCCAWAEYEENGLFHRKECWVKQHVTISEA